MCSEKASHRISVRGSPIRKSTDHGMCAPPRRLSQLTTSFFAYTRLVIHHLHLVACQKHLSIGKTSIVTRHSRPEPSGPTRKPCPNFKTLQYSTVKEPRPPPGSSRIPSGATFTGPGRRLCLPLLSEKGRPRTSCRPENSRNIGPE